MILLHLITRVMGGVASRWRNVWFRGLGVRLNGYVWMRAIEIPRLWGAITLGKRVSLDRGVTLLCSGSLQPNKLVINDGTYINRYTMFDAHEHIEVGRNCMIGPHCYITDANHGTALGAAVKDQPMDIKPVLIEDDVWLGAGVIVLAGVRLGHGAIVGAGAVVTKTVLPNAVVVGNPAQEINRRS